MHLMSFIFFIYFKASDCSIFNTSFLLTCFLLERWPIPQGATAPRAPESQGQRGKTRFEPKRFQLTHVIEDAV